MNKKEKKIEQLAGEITHFYSNINVAVIKVKKALSVGSKIRIKGSITDFKQKISSMEVEHRKIKKARKGQLIGLKVSKRVRIGDLVYLLG